jgi:prolipoprotein diacylglyceryl transferase
VIPSSIPSPPPDWSSFDIPLGFTTLTIHVYAIAILIGIAVAIIVSNYRLTARGAEPWIVIDISIWAVVFGIIGSRAWHVATHPDDFFGEGKLGFGLIIPNFTDPANGSSVWAVWMGGVAIFGAVLFGALGVFIACRIAGLRFTSAVDAMAPTLLLAQAFGRLGNYFNQELFGLPTDLPWGLQIDRPNPAIPVGIPDDALFHPTFLYEIIWLVAGFVILMLIENRVSISSITTAAGAKLPKVEFARRDSWYWGKMVGLYAIWYGLGRVWFESIRLDPSETLLGIRSNVWGALAFILAGILIIAIQTARHPGIEASVYRPGKEWTPGSAVDSDEIYSDDETGDDAESTTPAPATSGASRN